MTTHVQLDQRAARLRAGRSAFADAFKVTIRTAPDGEGEIDTYGEPGQTVAARRHFSVSEPPSEEYGLLTWRHHVGRPGHGLLLTFTEPIGSAS